MFMAQGLYASFHVVFFLCCWCIVKIAGVTKVLALDTQILLIHGFDMLHIKILINFIVEVVNMLWFARPQLVLIKLFMARKTLFIQEFVLFAQTAMPYVFYVAP